MKLGTLLLFCIAILSCKQASKESTSTNEISEVPIDVANSRFPEAFTKILKAHGGLDTWREKRTLTFEIPKPETKEVHTTDLSSRIDKIEMQQFSLGFDGQQVWLSDKDQSYKGDPVFYHNLMFYFYAMPFVLADGGINYSKTENLEFEGTSYPGIRISYNTGVGTSPKDEYFIHYHPETYQMEWLGYTVTYRSGEKSDHVKWIRYDDWMPVEGLLLPKSITWFDNDGKTMKEAKNKVAFEKVGLTESKKPDGFYKIPEGARIVKGKKK